MKIFAPETAALGDFRIVKQASGYVYVQELVAGGWEYTQLHLEQTLGSCVGALKDRGYEYMGKSEDAGRSCYHYRKTYEIIPAGVLTLGDLEDAYRSGNLSSMDVFHLINGNPTTGEE